jgi:hypothetical protein
LFAGTAPPGAPERGAVRADAESFGSIGRFLGEAAARCRGADIVRASHPGIKRGARCADAGPNTTCSEEHS